MRYTNTYIYISYKIDKYKFIFIVMFNNSYKVL